MTILDTVCVSTFADVKQYPHLLNKLGYYTEALLRVDDFIDMLHSCRRRGQRVNFLPFAQNILEALDVAGALVQEETLAEPGQS